MDNPITIAMKAKSLQDLRALRQALSDAAARQAEQLRLQQQAQHRAQAQGRLFRDAVGPVQALKSPPHERHWHAPVPPQPLPVQRQLDEARVLRESLSDEFDASTLLHVDEHLSFRRPGIGPDVTTRLRRGHWAVQAQVDLHGLRTDEAREALGAFLREARRAGLRCVRVVHGKGLGSPGRVPVLKAKVHGWLIQKKEVLAFVQARPLEGGAGALLVLLGQPER